MLLQVDIFLFIWLRELLMGHIHLFMCLHFSPSNAICRQNKDKLKGGQERLGTNLGQLPV